MDIQFNEPDNKVLLNHLNDGEVFKLNGYAWMKISRHCAFVNDRYQLVVCLNTGMTSEFDKEMKKAVEVRHTAKVRG